LGIGPCLRPVMHRNAAQRLGRCQPLPRATPKWDDALVRVARDVDPPRKLGAKGRDRADRDFSGKGWGRVVAGIPRGER
jgi:hypothetical protein